MPTRRDGARRRDSRGDLDEGSSLSASQTVARMERSEIRDQPVPDFAALHPGYQAAMSFSPLLRFFDQRN